MEVKNHKIKVLVAISGGVDSSVVPVVEPPAHYGTALTVYV